MKTYIDIIKTELHKRGITSEKTGHNGLIIRDYIEEIGLSVMYVVSAIEIAKGVISITVQSSGISKINNRAKVLEKINEINANSICICYGLSEQNNVYCRRTQFSRDEYIIDDCLRTIGILSASIIEVYPEIMKANWS